MTKNNNIIEIKNLTKEYKDVTAVNKLNLSIKENELFSLLGVNGAGKTTTIKMLTGILKPTAGDATILDVNLANINDVKDKINVSPQETAVAPNLSVKENLEFIANIYGLKKEEARNKVNEMIKLFDLKKIVNKKADKLSGGWQRKLSIAMAVITNPTILFLDEPTLGLDVIARRELWNVIKELKKHTTIILTTHYMEEAEMLSDRIGIMYNGSLIEMGTPKELISKAKTKTFEDAFVKIVEEAK